MAEPGDESRKRPRNVVEMESVSRHFADGTGITQALREISLKLESGKFTAVTGPSGSGKTTLLNLVGCIDRATTGSITVCGKDVQALSDDALSRFRAERIGFIFQNFNLIPVLSVYENVAYPLVLKGVRPGRQRAMVDEILDSVGLLDMRSRLPDTLSGGERQRVAIARALVKSPELVLADEPTANLDSKTGDVILALMREMQRKTKTSFVISTHDPNVVSGVDVVVSIRDGALESSNSKVPL